MLKIAHHLEKHTFQCSSLNMSMSNFTKSKNTTKQT